MATDLIHAALLYRTSPHRDFPVPQGEATLGYASSNLIRVPIKGVSRRHARVSYDGKDYWIEDAGSANGTFLNGKRVTKRERLRHLDVVSLGRHTDLIFVRKTTEVTRTKRHGIKAAWLEALDGVEEGTRREIPRGSFTIGRALSNNIVADSKLVSGIHARIERSSVQLVLTDLQSANGTFVEGKRIESEILKDGDEINLGNVRTYRVRIEEGEVVTRDVARPRAPDSPVTGTLPTDWKTRIEWTPEEQAALDRAMEKPRRVVPGSARTFKQVPSQGARTAAAPKPHSGRTPSPPKPAETAPGAPAISGKKITSPAPAKVAPAAPPSAPISTPSSAPREPLASRQARPPSPGRKELPKPPTSAPPGSRPAFSPDTAHPISSSAALMPQVLLEGEIQKFSLSAGDHEVGRLPTCSVRIESPQVSRRHAVIRVTQTEAVLEDLQSVNGTFVNDQRLTAPRSLANRDRISFGGVVFRVHFVERPGARPKAAEGKRG